MGEKNVPLVGTVLNGAAQRGARAGCSGTIDNLLIDRTVTLDCHRRKGNLSMGWIEGVRLGRPWLVGGDNDPAEILCLVIKDGREVK